MCPHQLLETHFTQAPVRQLHSLRNADIDAAIAELDQLAKEWEFDQHDECDGDVMLILTPPDQGRGEVSFVLCRSIGGLQLAAVHDETYETLGTFDAVSVAVQAMVAAAAPTRNSLACKAVA